MYFTRENQCCTIRQKKEKKEMDRPIKGYWYKELDSTMDEAKRLIGAGKVKDVVYVVANYQTKGRGSYGRKWDSPKGKGIYLSIIHLPGENGSLKLTTTYTKACGVACVETIRKICKINAKLKPINDIYVDGKKLGGILVESKIRNHGFSYLITGIGINIHKALRLMDRKVSEPTSLEEVMDRKHFQSFSKGKFIKLLVNNVCMWYEKIFDGEQSFVEKKWKAKTY